MLKLNIRQMCTIRGIDTPFKALTQIGVSRKVAHTYLTNARKTHIQVEHIELLCKLLNCTPSHLFVWQPGKADGSIKDTHPLKELLPKPMLDPHEKLVAMSVEDLNKFLSM